MSASYRYRGRKPDQDQLRFLLLYFMLVSLRFRWPRLQTFRPCGLAWCCPAFCGCESRLGYGYIPKPGNETLMRVKLIQMRFLSATQKHPPSDQIACTLPQVTAYTVIYISNMCHPTPLRGQRRGLALGGLEDLLMRLQTFYVPITLIWTLSLEYP